MEFFHPAVRRWFERRFGAPTAVQAEAWPALHAGGHALIAAPTGSGKTLAAFLAALDGLLRRAVDGELRDAVEVVYVSPLKALSNDVQKNLAEPLAGIAAEAAALGLAVPELRTLVRTGDTPAAERAAMGRRPPHVLVTTPESLYILLTSAGGRRLLATARTVIVDEIHVLAGNKRGAHLALSLERLEALCGGKLQRIGLSATQRPVERVARFLIGERRAACAIVDLGHRRDLDLALELPRSPLETVMSMEVWEEVYDRLAELVREHRTTLVFVNTRRLAERVARHLGERLGPGQVAAHHGSLARERRLDAEQRLKRGELRALVATASLELGIDIGTVDLVCQLGSTRTIATFLQRVGRAGHRQDLLPKGRLFPLSVVELVEAAALFDAVERGELEELAPARPALDILAQQIAAEVAAEDWSEDELYALVRRAAPFSTLSRATFDEVVAMLAEGFAGRRGRRGALLHRDRVHGRLRARKGARLVALTNGGAIPDQGEFQVVLDPSGVVVGSVNEDFAVESMSGDVFQLGTASWRVRRLEQGKLLVEDARGTPPSIPFWFGEAPARSAELSRALWRLHRRVAESLGGEAADPGRRAVAAALLAGDLGIPEAAAGPIVEHLAAGLAALGALPDGDTLIAERFFDEAGDQHLVVHAPFGSRLNRAWGLALRKRFCQTFNFELQAAATEDAILLSLGPTHSFELADVFRFVHSSSVRHVLTQALLDAPMFAVRWRWNANRSLALRRFRFGRRVPPRLQRQEAEDLVAVVFPDQLACFENLQGEREIPSHPLVEETLHDCLTEVMDVEGLEALLRRIEAGELRLIARDLTEPSPLAREVLAARPYSFLDDAPLEERRAQAVQARRFLRPEDAAALGALDAAAIARVRAEAWPRAEDAEELHDALLAVGALTAEEGRRAEWTALFAALIADRRATELRSAERCFWVAAERLAEWRALAPASAESPRLELPAALAGPVTAEAAARALVRDRLAIAGPIEVAALAELLGLATEAVAAALAALETEGVAMRGRFSPGASEEQWCDRRLLARIHRATLERLRREIEPVAKSDFVRFLLGWQRLEGASRASGAEGLAAVADLLEGFAAPAGAWESELFAARMAKYEPAWLDTLCLSGRFAWCRLAAPASPRGGPVRSTPIAFVRRENLAAWRALAGRDREEPELGAAARAVALHLERHGASFFGDLVRGGGLLPAQAEAALGELVAAGRVVADGFAGLRALLTPELKRRRGANPIELGGRWSLLPPPEAGARGAAVEIAAAALLRRYGVVFRRLLGGESHLPPWRELVTALRRMEDRGEVRGGRFVDGVSGEQYALPEALAKLRAVRRAPDRGELVALSAADPANLLGTALPGERVAALTGNRLLYRGGEAIAVRAGGGERLLVELDAAAAWQARTALKRSASVRLARSA